MIADELGIQLTRQPAQHPYDAIKARRLHDEAMEWRRITKLQMVNAPDYESSLPFIEDFDSIPNSEIVALYREIRTPELAEELRASIRDTDLWQKAFMPLAEKYVLHLAAMSDEDFERWTYSSAVKPS
jgi:hypothetical protein